MIYYCALPTYWKMGFNSPSLFYCFCHQWIYRQGRMIAAWVEWGCSSYNSALTSTCASLDHGSWKNDSTTEFGTAMTGRLREHWSTFWSTAAGDPSSTGMYIMASDLHLLMTNASQDQLSQQIEANGWLIMPLQPNHLNFN